MQTLEKTINIRINHIFWSPKLILKWWATKHSPRVSIGRMAAISKSRTPLFRVFFRAKIYQVRGTLYEVCLCNVTVKMSKCWNVTGSHLIRMSKCSFDLKNVSGSGRSLAKISKWNRGCRELGNSRGCRHFQLSRIGISIDKTYS